MGRTLIPSRGRVGSRVRTSYKLSPDPSVSLTARWSSCYRRRSTASSHRTYSTARVRVTIGLSVGTPTGPNIRRGMALALGSLKPGKQIVITFQCHLQTRRKHIGLVKDKVLGFVVVDCFH